MTRLAGKSPSVSPSVSSCIWRWRARNPEVTGSNPVPATISSVPVSLLQAGTFALTDTADHLGDVFWVETASVADADTIIHRGTSGEQSESTTVRFPTVSTRTVRSVSEGDPAPLIRRLLTDQLFQVALSVSPPTNNRFQPADLQCGKRDVHNERFTDTVSGVRFSRVFAVTDRGRRNKNVPCLGGGDWLV